MRPWGAVAVMVLVAGIVSVGHAEGPAAAAIPENVTPRPEVKIPVYDTAGKRDPFRPFTLDLRETAQREPMTPLQRYDIGQLTVVGLLWAVNPPRAMVEDSIGMGYIVTIGTPIGRHGGVVKAIEPDRVVVEERVPDFYGQEQITEVVMELPKDTGTERSGRERR